MNQKRRLEALERAATLAAIHYQESFARAQAEYGLPLPEGSDIHDGLRRLQDCLARCKDATADERNSIMDGFKAWVLSEHERCKNG